MKKKTGWLILSLLTVQLVVSSCYERRYSYGDHRDHHRHERRGYHRH